MFKINFLLVPDIQEFDLLNMDETQMRYAIFVGSVTLEADESSINLNWGWIPLIDFAISLDLISKQLARLNNAKETFEFTESDDKLFFEREEDMLSISTSFSHEILKVDFEQFIYEVKIFCNRVFAECQDVYKNISRFNWFKEAVKQIEEDHF